MSAFESISQDPAPPGSLDESTSAAVSHQRDMADGLARLSEHLQRLRSLIGNRVDLRNGSDLAISSAAAVLGEIVRDMLSVSTRMEESELLTLREEKAMLVLESLQMYLDLASITHSFRRQATHLIVKVADRSHELPSSLFLEGVTLTSSDQLCGGFADVYQGIYEGKSVAIKMPRALEGDDTDRKRMCREALVWRQLRHDHVLPFLGLDNTSFPLNKFSCMVSPWMKHGMLMDYIKTSNYSAERDLLRMIRGTASGLAYLHSIQVIHGDLSDTNILIDDDHHPQLADFGLVLLEDCTRAGFTATKNGFKLRWASPQRLDNMVRTRSDDVYSFACLVYYLFSGIAPFQKLSSFRAGNEILGGNRPERPQAIWSGVLIEPSDAIWDLTERCWHAEPGMRLDISDVYSSLCQMTVADVSHLHTEKAFSSSSGLQPSLAPESNGLQSQVTPAPSVILSTSPSTNLAPSNMDNPLPSLLHGPAPTDTLQNHNHDPDQRNDEARATARACGDLAISLRARYDQTGDVSLLNEAIELGRKSLSLQPEGDSGRAKACGDLAVSLQMAFDRHGKPVQLLHEAVSLGREALSLYPPGHMHRAQACGVLSGLLQASYNVTADHALLDEAIALGREALALRPAGTGDSNRAQAMQLLADSLKTRSGSIGEADMESEATSLYRGVLVLCPPGHPDRWQSLLRLAEHDLDHHDPESAIRNVQEAMTAVCRMLPRMLSRAVAVLQRIQSSGVPGPVMAKSLLQLYSTALNLATVVTGFVLDRSLQLYYTKEYRNLGSGAFICGTQSNDWSSAFPLLERARGIVWSQTLYLRDPQLEDVPATLAEELSILLRGLSASSNDNSTVMPDSGTFLTEQDRRHSQHGRLQRILQEIRSLPGLHDFMRGLGFQTLLQSASRNPVVVLVAEDSGCHALVIRSPTDFVHIALPGIDARTIQAITYSEIGGGRGFPGDSDVQRIGFKLKRTLRVSASAKILERLWHTVVKPVLSALDVTQKLHGRCRPRVHWCSTGLFAFVPVHAAGIYRESGPYQECMSDYIVSSYTPTLTALLRAQQKSHVSIRSQLKLSVVAVAHTNTRALPTIKGVRQEASEIAAIAAAANISCDVKLEATKSQASAAFMTANLLHIASHGIQDESDPLKSAFILADGDLSTSEIMDMNLDNAFLAFLSSCETAKGDQNYADEVIHLAATMIFAGFTSVVASMWSVADVDAPVIAKHFYEHLLQEKTLTVDAVPYALDHAVQKLKESGVPPQRWAPWIHMGA